jgi:hypothetical protein
MSHSRSVVRGNFAGSNKGVMIKNEPAVPFSVSLERFLFSSDNFQRIIIIGHDPEGIEMGMCRTQVTKMDRRFVLGADLDHLMPRV